MKAKLLGALALLLAGTGGFHYRHQAVERISAYLSPLEEDPVPTLKLERKNYRVTVFAPGELTGLQTTPIVTPRVRTGALKVAWLVEEGTIVSAKDEVARFDSTDAQLALQQNQTTFDSHQHRISKAQEDGRSRLEILGIEREEADLEWDYARQQVHRDEEIFSRWEIQEAIMSAALAQYKTRSIETKTDLNQQQSRADLSMLKIEQQKAETEIKLAQQTLSSLQMLSPVEGVVLYRRRGLFETKVGDDAWPGQEILEIANLRQFQGRIQIVESDVAGVRVGIPVEVELAALPGHTFSGKINRVATVPQQSSRSDPRKFFSCDVLLDVPLETMSQLKPGMQLSARLEVAHREDVLAVPKSAVIKKEADFVVFLKEGESYREQKVTLVDSDYGFYVIEGVEEGREICLQHPFEKQRLHLPDFSGPSTPTQMRRFIMF